MKRSACGRVAAPRARKMLRMDGPNDERVQDALQRYYAYVMNATAPATAQALSGLRHRLVHHAECERKEKCTLCLEELNKGEDVTELPCGHVFHRTSADHAEGCQGVTRWLKESRTCPQCRLPVVASNEVPTESEQLLIPLILKQYRLIREQQRLINTFLSNKQQERASRTNGVEAKRRNGRRPIVIRNRDSFSMRSSIPFVPSLQFENVPLGWQAEFLRSGERNQVLTRIWTILFSQLKQEAQGNLTTIQCDKLDRISKRIESMLFLEAQTFADYEDPATLQVRSMRKLHMIMKICRSALVQQKLQATT